MRHSLLFVLLGILLLVSCESYDCTLYNYVGMYSTFYKDGKAASLGDTLSVTTGKSGMVLLNRSVGTSKTILPLSYWQDVDTLVFNVKGDGFLLQDTVWIAKTNFVHYEAPDCPSTLFHTIQDVRCTHKFIKDITIVRSSVNYETTENLQIHLHSVSD